MWFNALSSGQITMLVVWIVVIAVGIIVESQTSALVSIWFSLSSAVAIVCALADLSVYIQIAVFAAITLVMIFATRPLAKKLNAKGGLKTNVDRLIGMVAKVTETIEPDQKGSVKVDFQDWTAISYKNKRIEKDTKVVVKAVSGNKLIVDIIEEIEIK
ncbi:MAG: NfeD family protein [Bacilli bacterium]|nr:NfeD family protein [Bacilli bacterium]